MEDDDEEIEMDEQDEYGGWDGVILGKMRPWKINGWI